MRLINTSTYELREFYEKQIPRYAILSHRWEEDAEVTFQDFQAGRGPQLRGWNKIEGCCARAAKDGWRYCWIDSCCIDKTSSAELSEAINSMFEWYRRAEVCYAYLADVNTASTYYSMKENSFRKSVWFTRGWTLQELLAPQWVEFYDVNWKEIGTKSSLAFLISSITGIQHLFNFADASVAQKMSWASRRQTTRVEDQAYCLLGLFGVHMPPLYGEGKNAFRRLQMEIISQSDDESIFAWSGRSHLRLGLLAASPEQFKSSGNIIRGVFDPKRQPYSMTNQGLRLELLIKETTNSPPLNAELRSETESFIAPLNCLWESESHSSTSSNPQYVGLPLCRTSDLNISRSWFRRGKIEPFETSPEFNVNNLSRTTIYAESLSQAPVFSRPQTVIVRLSTQCKSTFSVCQKLKPDTDGSWSTDSREGEILSSFYKSDEVAALVYKDENSARFAVVLGSSAYMFWINLVVEEEGLDRMIDLASGTLFESHAHDKHLLAKPASSDGVGDRIFGKLPDGRVVSAMSKKELRAASYRFVVDIAISKPDPVTPSDLEVSQFHLGEELFQHDTF